MGRHTNFVARATESPAENPVDGPLRDVVIADDPFLDLLRDDE